VLCEGAGEKLGVRSVLDHAATTNSSPNCASDADSRVPSDAAPTSTASAPELVAPNVTYTGNGSRCQRSHVRGAESFFSGRVGVGAGQFCFSSSGSACEKALSNYRAGRPPSTAGVTCVSGSQGTCTSSSQFSHATILFGRSTSTASAVSKLDLPPDLSVDEVLAQVARATGTAVPL